MGNSTEISENAVSSSKIVGRLLELAKEFRSLWNAATLSEKKKFASLLVESITIHPEKKMAEIRMTHNYLQAKELANGQNSEFFLADGRGDPNLSKRILPPIYLHIQFDVWKPRCA
ncbi:MAG: hypothetical protein JW909_10430 [Planctomycetes bacterium]|nr:hypothetical protein [Planctomycetota bacterium]